MNTLLLTRAQLWEAADPLAFLDELEAERKGTVELRYKTIKEKHHEPRIS